MPFFSRKRFIFLPTISFAVCEVKKEYAKKNCLNGFAVIPIGLQKKKPF
jgi:hypothetical protein